MFANEVDPTRRCGTEEGEMLQASARQLDEGCFVKISGQDDQYPDVGWEIVGGHECGGGGGEKNENKI